MGFWERQDACSRTWVPLFPKDVVRTASVLCPQSANFAVQVPKQIGYYWPTDVKEAVRVAGCRLCECRLCTRKCNQGMPPTPWKF